MSRAGAASALALALTLALGAPFPSAASDPASVIEDARADLTRAGRALERASTPPEKLEALGRAAAAAEAALGAYRLLLRALAAEEASLAAAMAGDRESAARLVSALDSLSRAPRSALLAYPGGPIEAIRAASLMAAIAPELDRRRIDLALRLDRLAELRLREEAARAEAETLLAELQHLRAEAYRAVREHHGRAPADRALAAQAAAASARARDLAGLADALAGRGETATTAGTTTSARGAAAGFGEPPTPLPLPVAGRVTAGFHDHDPWGRRGAGLTLSAPPWAEVRAPVNATLRYAGPLTDYGQVAILEPRPGWLIVLAGLGRITRAPGETVLAGEALGDLGGLLPENEEFLLEATGKDGEILDRKLYIEVRRDGQPIDPEPWFGNGGKRGP